MVERKIKAGHTHVIEEPDQDDEEKAPRAEVVDLMPLLKKSVESREKKAGDSRDKKPRARAGTGRAGDRSKARRARSA
jgi:non-homologous end joining protein Ku